MTIEIIIIPQIISYRFRQIFPNFFKPSKSATWGKYQSHNSYSESTYVTWSSPICLIWYHYWVHSKKKTYFLEIGPIRYVKLTCIFLPFLSLYVVSKIGLGTIYFLIHTCFQMLSSWNWIMFCALFWCIIRKNVYFEVIYLFPLHQHTATINSTIRQHSCYITYIQQTLKDRSISGFGKSLRGRSWLWFKLYGFNDS